MKLQLKHLAGYLPYGLKVMRPDNKTILELSGSQGSLLIFSEGTYGQIGNKGNKPILRPLSDLTKEIKVNGEKYRPIDELWKYHNFSYLNLGEIKTDPTRYPYTIVEKLLEWHFDIYGLIENGLAIDINTL